MLSYFGGSGWAAGESSQSVETGGNEYGMPSGQRGGVSRGCR